MTTNTNADWKCGNEFLPYHPGASHVEPAYRDGWNDCYRAALTTAAVPPEGWPLASAADRAMRAQAAPAAVAGPDRQALIDVIAQGLSDTWHCLRVWEAWNVGTMSQDDFEPVDESDTPAELADAILALLAAAPTTQAAPQQQELLAEIQRLQRALAFWLPQVPSEDHPLQERIAHDAFLPAGYYGTDEPSAYELGHVALAGTAAPVAQ